MACNCNHFPCRHESDRAAREQEAAARLTITGGNRPATMCPDRDDRQADLAKIHIAKKVLCLSEDDYRQIIRSVGKAATGSSADLSQLGRARVLSYLRKCSWKPTRTAPKRITPAGAIIASEAQIKLIKDIWVKLGDSGVVRDRTEIGLRHWVKSASRRWHGQKVGWSDLRFLPAWVAQRLIENLKQWAKRCGVKPA